LTIALGVDRYCFNSFNRPAATTATLLPAAFLCGIFSAVYIWIGSKRTRRIEKVEERLRIALDMERRSSETEGSRNSQQMERNSNAPVDEKVSQNVTARDFGRAAESGMDENPRADAASPTRKISIPNIVVEEEIIVPPHEHIANQYTNGH
jgi:hypothetical protein